MKAPQFWWDDSAGPRWLAQALRPAGALVCRLASRRLARAARGEGVGRLPVPVIVVGNLTVGGAGKSPLVMALVERLRAAGHKPGVISRGYGVQWRRGEPPRQVTAKTSADVCGDEALMIHRRTSAPVFVHPDRVAAGMALLEAHPEVGLLVSDDGLQHHALGRDFEIAVVDRLRGFGNGRCLPAGPLREPADRLALVDAVVMNTPVRGTLPPQDTLVRAHLAARTGGVGRMQLIPRGFVHLATGEQRPTSEPPARSVQAVAGIGDPARFFRTLDQLGLNVTPHALADHARLPSRLRRQLDDPQTVFVMTEKDAVKWPVFSPDRPHYYLRVDAHLDGDWIESLLERLARAGTPG
ncbi:MAG: tetraacyldisaccharide 4'-kinase [Halothiobacillaceae bacterium]